MDRLAFQEWPAVLRRRWILIGAAGIGFLLVGLAVFFSLGDLVLLMLSGMLTLCTLLHCVEFYRTVRRRRYQAIEVTCIALGRPSIGRRREIQLLLQDGREVVVTWDKRVNLRLGHRYRIFYRLDCGRVAEMKSAARPFMRRPKEYVADRLWKNKRLGKEKGMAKQTLG